ncbi:MAG: DUF1127 domain-containing protein [Arenicellales bacterium]|nr:DUF1127 domain-containing protein [Arenicellales bacterium]
MNIIDRINRRRRINRTIQELSSLQDNVLSDIGIERGNITELAEKMVDANEAAKRPLERHEPAKQPGYQVPSGATA